MKIKVCFPNKTSIITCNVLYIPVLFIASKLVVCASPQPWPGYCCPFLSNSKTPLPFLCLPLSIFSFFLSMSLSLSLSHTHKYMYMLSYSKFRRRLVHGGEDNMGLFSFICEGKSLHIRRVASYLRNKTTVESCDTALMHQKEVLCSAGRRDSLQPSAVGPRPCASAILCVPSRPVVSDSSRPLCTAVRQHHLSHAFLVIPPLPI